MIIFSSPSVYGLIGLNMAQHLGFLIALNLIPRDDNETECGKKANWAHDMMFTIHCVCSVYLFIYIFIRI